MKTQLKGMIIVMGLAVLMSACGDSGAKVGEGGKCNHDCCGGYGALSVSKCVIGPGPEDWPDPLPKPKLEPEPKIDALPPAVSGVPEEFILIPVGGQKMVGPVTIQSEGLLKEVAIKCDSPFVSATPDQAFDSVKNAQSYQFSLTVHNHQQKIGGPSLCLIQATDQAGQPSKIELVQIISPGTVQMDVPPSVLAKTGGSQSVYVSASFSPTSQRDSILLQCSRHFDLSEINLADEQKPLVLSQLSHELMYHKKMLEENTHHYVMSFGPIVDTIHCTMAGTGDDGSSGSASFKVVPTPNDAPLYVTPVIDEGKSIIHEMQVKSGTHNSVADVRIHSDVGLDKVEFSCNVPSVTATSSHPFSKWPKSWGMHYLKDYQFDLLIGVDATAPAMDTTCAVSATDILGQTKNWRVLVHTL